jgi:uncharacterized protein YrrD
VIDLFRASQGRKVVSRATAEALGALTHLLIDSGHCQVRALVVGSGRHARLIDWEHVSGFGPDAVMVESHEVLRPPAGDHEQAAVEGKLELVGKRALSERGNEKGSITDVEFDPESGAIGAVLIGEERVPPTDVLGLGSYAAVLASHGDNA